MDTNTPATNGELAAKTRVICFTSAKGGSGKTVFAASTAYALLRAGKKVLCIDTDFSTRGLSLFLLSSLIDAGDLRIPEQSCLAESLLAETPPERLKPLTVAHEGIEFSVLVSNSNLRQGGVPEDRLLGNPSKEGLSLSRSVEVTVRGYSSYFKRLCDVMRQQFEYIIIDTRGGFDTTSVVPAVVSDWYCIVLEADEISVQQVFGLKTKIDEYQRLLDEQTHLKGFIVNKALFSPSDKGFATTVSHIYGGQPLGTVPADRAAIKAYQKKNFAFESAPESDFSYYCYQVIANSVAGDQSNWTPSQEAEFRELGAQIGQKWRWRARFDWIQTINPYVALGLLLLSGIGYWITTRSFASWVMVPFYVIAVLTVLWCFGVLCLTLLARWRQEDFFKVRGWTTVASVLVLAAIFFGVVYLAVFDVPRRFSSNILYRTIAEQSKRIADQQSQLTTMQAKLDQTQQELTVAKLTHQGDLPAQTVLEKRWESYQTVNCDQTKEQTLFASIPPDSGKVLSVQAALEDVSNLREQQVDVVGWSGNTAQVKLRLAGLVPGPLKGCPGGGHARVVVNFATLHDKGQVGK
jgi:cellulose biosynthesis protein BcsQ